MNDWNIQSRASACEACAQPFADQQPLHTLLFDEHAEDLRRMDVCEACWQNQFSDGARERKGFISHWQSIYEAPAAAGRRDSKGNRRDAAAQAHRAERPALRARRLHPRRHARTQTRAQGEGSRSSATASACSFTSSPEPATCSPSPTRPCDWTNSNKSSATWRLAGTWLESAGAAPAGEILRPRRKSADAQN